MNKEQINIFNKWIAPVTRNHIRDIISKYYKNTQWPIKFGGSALDIGCGDGSASVKVLKELLPESAQLWATDNSQDMIDTANFRYGNCGVKFVVSDVLDDEVYLRYRFDCVFSFYCLHNVTNQRKALKNIYNMLTHNGHCFLSVLSRNTFYEVYENLAHKSRWSPYMLNVESCQPALHGLRDVKLVYENWLCEAGFNQVKVLEEKRKIVYDSWEKFEGLMQFTNPFYWKIPENLQQEYMFDYKEGVMKLGVVREVHDKYGDFAGIEETYYNLVAFGVKL